MKVCIREDMRAGKVIHDNQAL